MDGHDRTHREDEAEWRPGPLDGILERAGAVMAVRRAARVAAHFGSVAAEIAVCRRTVGLADCSGLAKLELRGDDAALTRWVSHQHPSPPGAGGPASDGSSPSRHGRASAARGAWWCPVTPNRMLVLGGAVAPPVEPGVSAIDLTDDYAAIAVIGPRCGALLWRLGLADAELEVGSFETRRLGRVPALVLVQHPQRALVLVARAHAPRAWQTLCDAGHPDRVACVGHDALELLSRSTVPAS